MSSVIPFRPRHEFDAESNLRDFIEHCKSRLTLYGEDLDWDAPRWDVSGRHRFRGVNQKKAEMVFGALGSTRWAPKEMHEAFMDFAKAYMRHYLTFSGAKIFSVMLGTLRILEQALIACSRDGVPRIIMVDETVMTKATEIMRLHFSTLHSQYTYGAQLQKILEFLVEKSLLVTPIEWKNPFPCPQSGNLVGEEHDRRRAEKLPSRETLAALGTIFDQATDTRDVVISSAIALLCCAPGRVCEVVTIQNHSEVWLDNGDGTKDLGLRWYPGKGGKKGIKPVVKTMEPIAIRAIERTRDVTELAREMARWYEKNPDKIYLPPELEHLRQKEMISGEELALLFGWKSAHDAPKMARLLGLTDNKAVVMVPSRWHKNGTRGQMQKKVNVFTFDEVEKKVLSYLPSDFPWLDRENSIRYSEALFVVPRGTFNPQRGNMRCMFEGVGVHTVIQQLGGRAQNQNIFLRFGLTKSDGSRMQMGTHQARHWLNTIAERGGLSDIERDMWSGRVTSTKRNGEAAPGRQSLAYLHNTTEELMEAAGLNHEDMDRTSFAAAIAKLPVSVEELKALEDKPTIHFTEYGACFHDFAMQPCPVHADCLNCMEHACIKGDREKAERIREVFLLGIEQIKMARKMVEEGYLKAEPWYQHQALTVRRVEALLQHLDDESLPPNTIIMLVNPFQYSAFRNAIEGRAAGVGDETALRLAEFFKTPALPAPEEVLGYLTEIDHAPSL